MAVILILALVAGFGAASVVGQDGKWGHLKGRIVLDGPIPEMKKITPSKAEDKKYCEDNKIVLYEEDFVVDKKTRGILGVFVMMYHGRDADLGKKIPVHPSYLPRLREKVVIDNKNLRFAPYSQIVMIGQEVVLRNSDTVGHNVRLPAGKNAFNSNVPAGADVSLKDTVKHAERLPYGLECNMHDWMKGRILVRHEPYNIVTDKDGNFEIKNIPAGKYKFQFWQTKYLQLTDESGKKLTDRRGTIEVEIKDGETLDLGKLTTKLK